MDNIMFVIVGVIIGFAGSRVPLWQRDKNVGWSIAVGILGAFGGAMLGWALGYSTHAPATFVASVLGAVVFVTTYLGIMIRRTA